MVFYWQESLIINVLSKYDHSVQQKSDACMIMWSQLLEILIRTTFLYTAGHLRSEWTANQIVRSITELALSLKSHDNKISIFLTVPGNDNLNNKASEVNSRLTHICIERNIAFIDHTNYVESENHVDESKLLFKRYGTIVFVNSISRFLSEHYWWHHDSSNINHLLQENFSKESKC